MRWWATTWLQVGLAGAQDTFHAVLSRGRDDRAGIDWSALCHPRPQALANEISSAHARFVVARSIQSELRLVLPSYMVPNHIVVLDHFPLTRSGKVDRRALPQPEASLGMAGYVAPRTLIEETIASIWAEALQLPRVGIQDDFFDIGGNSLLAIKVFHELNRRLNASLALSTIFKAPTVAELAAIIAVGHQPESMLVRLNRAKGERPLFQVHPVGGQVFFYQRLAQWIDGRMPVIGIQSPETAGLVHRFETLEAMAAAYASVMRDVQPAGPYRLAGWSSGGIIALAVARALEDQRCKVEYLGIVDS